MLLFAFMISVILIQASYQYLAFSFKLHLASATHLRVPLQGPQAPLLIGFIILSLMLLIEIGKAINKIRRGENVEEATI